MSKKRHTKEPMIRAIREHESGRSQAEICRQLNIAAPTFCRWKKQLGMMTSSDAQRRLASVTANGVTHSVAYVASSDLVASVSAPGLSITRSWEPARDLLSGVSASGGSTVSHAYLNDAAGLRRSADASYPGQANSTGDLSWLRDAAGRVTRETGTLPSTSSWTYDNAGNRLTAASGGTTLSLTTDSLNRYLSTGSGNATHDADGNLTYDPQIPRAVSPACKFTWDAAHRMTEARNFSGVSQVRLGYDAYGRLVRREHTSPLATGAGRAKVELYAHVGGLRVAVYSGNTSTKAVTLIRAIAWGPDLSGTVGGAGGIGGLLSVRETSASTSSRKGLTMLLGHDAKGDVTSVWSADGAYLGGYVTQAFGQVAILSGSATYLSENQWRLASKPLEWLTGYSHWGRRWYSPFLGRWVSRDPIGENGGVNLYGSCGNDMVSALDPWGEDESGSANSAGSFKEWFMDTATASAVQMLANSNIVLMPIYPHLVIGERMAEAVHTTCLETGAAYRMCRENGDGRLAATYNSGCLFIGTFVGVRDICQAHEGERLALDSNSCLVTARMTTAERWISGVSGTVTLIGTGFAAGEIAGPFIRTSSIATSEGLAVVQEIKILRPKCPGNTPVVNTTTKLVPELDAVGPHTTFRVDRVSGKVTKYETFTPQTNVNNPTPWESIKRVDTQYAKSRSHYNKVTKEYVPTLHVHDPKLPGRVRPATPDELPE